MATFLETFNKPDSAGLGPDLTWSQVVSGMGTVSGNASAIVASSNAQYLVIGDIGNNNRYISTIVTTVGSVHYCDIQLILRYTDANNYIAVMRGFSTVPARFVAYRSVVAGVISDTHVSVPWSGVPEVFRAEVDGTAVRAFIDAVEVGSWVTAETGTQFGLGGFRNSTAVTRLVSIDSYQAGPLSEPPVTFALTTNVVGNGIVIPSSGNFVEQSTIQIIADPGPGWLFVEWSGDAAGANNPLSLLMNANKSVTATFIASTGNIARDTAVRHSGRSRHFPYGGVM